MQFPTNNDINNNNNMGWQGPADYNQMTPFIPHGMQPGGMMPFQNQMGMSDLRSSPFKLSPCRS